MNKTTLNISHSFAGDKANMAMYGRTHIESTIMTVSHDMSNSTELLAVLAHALSNSIDINKADIPEIPDPNAPDKTILAGSFAEYLVVCTKNELEATWAQLNPNDKSVAAGKILGYTTLCTNKYTGADTQSIVNIAKMFRSTGKFNAIQYKMQDKLDYAHVIIIEILDETMGD